MTQPDAKIDAAAQRALTGARPGLWSAAMPKDRERDAGPASPRKAQEGAASSPSPSAKSSREARLAEALRANLRRRKAGLRKDDAPRADKDALATED